MDLGMNDTLNWGYMHCMIAASREMSDEPNLFNFTKSLNNMKTLGNFLERWAFGGLGG